MQRYVELALEASFAEHDTFHPACLWLAFAVQQALQIICVCLRYCYAQCSSPVDSFMASVYVCDSKAVCAVTLCTEVAPVYSVYTTAFDVL